MPQPAFSVFLPCACGCTLLNMDQYACTGPIPCVGPLHVSVRLWTLIHEPLPALFDGFSFCTWLYAPGREATCLYRPFSVCSPFARGCRPPNVDPRAGTGPFRSVDFVHVAVRVWTLSHMPLPAFFGVVALCTSL